MVKASAHEILPLFPLPDFVLFPHVHVPLHIFETRYREMMTEVLDGNGRFCMGTLVGNWVQKYDGNPDFHPTGCVCSVIDYERHPDGRYNILVEGVSRVQMAEVSNDRPFRCVEIRVDDMPAEISPANGAVQRLRELGSRALIEVIGEAPSGLAERMQSIELLTFLNLLAFHLPLDVKQKIDLIELPTSNALAAELLQHCERLHA